MSYCVEVLSQRELALAVCVLSVVAISKGYDERVQQAMRKFFDSHK